MWVVGQQVLCSVAVQSELEFDHLWLKSRCSEEDLLVSFAQQMEDRFNAYLGTVIGIAISWVG